MLFSDYIRGDELPKSLILEGGNVQIKSEAAQHIDLTTHKRDDVSGLIMKSLVAINQAFKEDMGLYLWKPSYLKQGEVFSGSTKHFFDKAITAEEFVKHKKSVGDIDLMVDENMKEQIRAFLEANEDKSFEHLTMIGSKPAGDQTITLWKLDPTGINVQMDFEFVGFHNEKPTEWSQFSHSSAWEDLQSGIKGAFHKLLMTSLMGHKKVDSILQMKTKQKEIKASLNALSIKGLRKKFEKIGEQDGKPVIRETGSKDWVTNFYAIMQEVFSIEATASDVEKFYTFNGILALMKAHLDKDKIEKILESFAEKLWGPEAQGLYRGEPNRDFEEKSTAFHFAEDKLDVTYDAEELEKLQVEYYSRYK